jgi:hypothetical protein
VVPFRGTSPLIFNGISEGLGLTHRASSVGVTALRSIRQILQMSPRDESGGLLLVHITATTSTCLR